MAQAIEELRKTRPPEVTQGPRACVPPIAGIARAQRSPGKATLQHLGAPECTYGALAGAMGA